MGISGQDNNPGKTQLNEVCKDLLCFGTYLISKADTTLILPVMADKDGAYGRITHHI